MEKLIKCEITVFNGELVVSSRVIANELGKRHDHVLRDLDKILTDPNLGTLILNSNYVDSKGENRREYLLTKDGFLLYMFSIRGYNDFKLAYINEFDRMKKELEDGLSEKDRVFLKIMNAQNDEQRLIAMNELNNKILLPLKDKADYTDKVLNTDTCLTTTQIAKQYGISGRKLNSILEQEGVQYKESGTWLLKVKYANKNYTKLRTYLTEDEETTYHSTVWTEKGREFINQIMNKHGYKIEQE